MQHKFENYYKNVKDLIKYEEFVKEINKIQNESDNLFNDSISALLIIDKLGRNNYSNIKISNLKINKEATIKAKVIEIGKIREFKKQNGSLGRVLNLKIMDETGICSLVFWDKDVDIVKTNNIQIGTIIKLINGTVKKGLNGIEINMGKWSSFEIIKNNITKSNGFISGQILEIQPSKAFFKDNGEYGFYTNITIKSKNQIITLKIWNERVKEIQKYKPGNLIKFENVEYKNINGKIENHVDKNTIIKTMKTNKT
jgi:replication factor A1